jgi:hypothetical protein
MKNLFSANRKETKQKKEPLEPEVAGTPSLEGIREIKTQGFTRFIPGVGHQVFLKVFIFRDKGEMEKREMSEAEFLEFQDRRGVFTVVSEPKDAPK